jgi:hypothetical protein
VKEVEMPQVSYQTIKLAKGKHSSRERGACVMELASMLAGEIFSDHPDSVSPTIAAFLRRYNDLIDDQHRQDLYAYAAKTVGTAASSQVEDARVRRLIAWSDEMWERRTNRRLLHRLRPRPAKELGTDLEVAGAYAIGAITNVCQRTHRAALALVDELIAIGSHPKHTMQTEDFASMRIGEPDRPGLR